MKKKIVAWMLTVMVAVTFVPMISFAEETPDDTQATTSDVQALATDEEKTDSDTKEKSGEAKNQEIKAQGYAGCLHVWEEDPSFEYYDNYEHIRYFTCVNCGEREEYYEPHDLVETGEYVYFDDDWHCVEYYCETCGYFVDSDDLYEHEFDFDDADCTKLNATYHLWEGGCFDCGAYMTVKGKHTWKAVSCARKATKLKKGSTKYKCKYCDAVKYVPFNWKYGSKYSIQYDITNHTNVYKNSNSITVWLKNPLKGAVIKVKVGGKTFKKTIKNSSKKQKVKIKIKKKWYGKTVSVKLYYKGKLVGKDRCYNASNPPYNKVLYGKNIKKGMTKKMVRNLYYWGPPDASESYSSGWTYWYYDDAGVAFKNGKVKSWYHYSY